MKNEEEIAEICKKESKIMLRKKWLGILPFPAALIVAIIYYQAISFAVNASDPSLVTKRGSIAGAIIVITVAIFAILIVAGYCYDKFLSKKLDRLWEQKKLLS